MVSDSIKTELTERGIGIIEFIIIGAVGMALFLAFLGGDLGSFITTMTNTTLLVP